MIEIEVEIKKREFAPKPKFHKLRLASCCMIPVILVGCGGFFLFQIYQNYAKANEASVQKIINQQEGKGSNGIVLPTDDPNSGDPYVAHAREINAVVPFAQTQWKPINNGVLNFFIQYPENASALVENASDDQLWFLRRDGYMFRIDIYQTNESMMSFYNALGDKANYSETSVTFAKHPALFLQQTNTTLKINSAQYIVANDGYIFELWYEVYPTGQYEDDTQRIQFMLKSFDFTNLPTPTPTRSVIRLGRKITY